MKKFIGYLSLFVLLVTGSVPVFTAYAQITEDSLGYKILAKAENPDELITVKDYKVINGDTADFTLDRKENPRIKARFIYIDTPEIKNNHAYALEAKERVEEIFNEAELIQVEYQDDEKDDQNRDLVYVWVDGILLQEILASEGLAIARYIEDEDVEDNVYIETIFESQDYAKRYGRNIWNDGDSAFLANVVYPSISNTGTVQVTTHDSPSASGSGASSSTSSTSSSTPSSSAPDISDTSEVTSEVVWEDDPVYEAESTPEPEYVYYQNCTIARNAGVTPIYRGEPGYASHLDRDGDGIACE